MKFMPVLLFLILGVYQSMANASPKCRYYFELLRPNAQITLSGSPQRRALYFAKLSDPIRKPEAILRKNFDPKTVLKNHGWDPNKMTIKVNRFVDGPNSSRFSIALSHNNDVVSFIMVKDPSQKFDKKDYLVVADILIIKRADHGRGLGSLMYLLAAHISATEFNASLTSNPSSFNPDHPEWLIPGHSMKSELAWVNFVRNGYAKELRHETFLDTQIQYVIDAEEWKSNTANQSIADFLTSHLAN